MPSSAAKWWAGTAYSLTRHSLDGALHFGLVLGVVQALTFTGPDGAEDSVQMSDAMHP